MSRSIHTTRRQLKEAKRADCANKDAQVAEVELLAQELKKKRRTKYQAVRYRHAKVVPPVTPVELIPITITCQHPFVHFPASPDDLRAVLNLLPTGIADGLAGIELSLGENVQREFDEECRCKPEKDPYTGRPGYETLPGVFTPRILGQYATERAKIKIYGYVYSPDLDQRLMWEFYLRLHMLMTFVHEVGHHHDRTMRMDRGRWRFDDEDKREYFAEASTHEWMVSCLLPYLERAYAKDLAQLRKWMKVNIGLKIPLELLAGEVRKSSKKGDRFAEAAFFNTASAFEGLVESLSKGKDLTKTRIQFARSLHYAHSYHLPLQIVELILVENPQEIEALAFRGDLFFHLEKYDLALRSAAKALALDPKNINAFEVVANIYETTKKWDHLLAVANELVRLSSDQFELWWALRRRAVAQMEMGNYQQAQQDIDELAKGPKSKKRVATRLQERMKECRDREGAL